MKRAVLAFVVMLAAWGCAAPFVRSAVEAAGPPAIVGEGDLADSDRSAEGEVKALLWDPPQMRLAYPVVRVVERSPCPEPLAVYGSFRLTHARVIRAYALFGGHQDFTQTCQDGPERD